jgi:hypothetical protein
VEIFVNQTYYGFCDVCEMSQDNVEYSDPPPPFLNPEPRDFYTKEDLKNEAQLQTQLQTFEALKKDLQPAAKYIFQGGKIYKNYAHKKLEQADEQWKTELVPTVWEKLSFWTQMALVGLVGLQVWRVGKGIVNWVWKKATASSEEDRMRKLLEQILQEGRGREHAREFGLDDGDDDDDDLDNEM